MAPGRRRPVRRKKTPPVKQRRNPPAKVIPFPQPHKEHGFGDRLRHAIGEAFPNLFGRGEKGPTPVEKRYFPHQLPENRELILGLQNLKFKMKLAKEDLRRPEYEHLGSNLELLALREELVRLIMSGKIKSHGQIKEIWEQLIKNKVEQGQIDPNTAQNLSAIIEEKGLFTRQESAKLKLFFGQFHREANISRIDIPPGQISSGANQSEKRAA